MLIKVSMQLLEIFQLAPKLFSVAYLCLPCINILLPLLKPPALEIVEPNHVGLIYLKNPSSVSYTLSLIVVFRTDPVILGVNTSLFLPVAVLPL